MRSIKNYFSILVLICSLSISKHSSSQTLADFFQKEKKVYWLGIDFTAAKMIGPMAEAFGAFDKSEQSLRVKYFPGWNNLVLDEARKFNLNKALRAATIVYDIQMITDLNASDTAKIKEQIVLSDPVSLQAHVKKYKYNRDSGLATVFIVDSFNKLEGKAIIYFVLFRAQDKQILLQQKITSHPSGLSMRNYWGNAIYSAIKKIQYNWYKRWKKAYKKQNHAGS